MSISLWEKSIGWFKDFGIDYIDPHLGRFSFMELLSGRQVRIKWYSVRPVIGPAITGLLAQLQLVESKYGSPSQIESSSGWLPLWDGERSQVHSSFVFNSQLLEGFNTLCWWPTNFIAFRGRSFFADSWAHGIENNRWFAFLCLEPHIRKKRSIVPVP